MAVWLRACIANSLSPWLGKPMLQVNEEAEKLKIPGKCVGEFLQHSEFVKIREARLHTGVSQAALALVLGTLLLSSPAVAADITHLSNIQWDLPSAWVGGVAPGKNDRAIISSGPGSILVSSPFSSVQDIGSLWITSTSTLTGFTNASMHILRFFGTPDVSGTGRIAALNESSRTVNFFLRTILADDLIFRASNGAGGGFNWPSSVAVAGSWAGLDLAGHTATFDTVNIANTMSFNSNAVIFGDGNIVKTGAGTLTIANASQYTGSTTIDTGTLALTDSGSIASSSVLNNNGLFDITGITASTSIKTLSGSGVVNVGTKTLVLTEAHDTFAGTFQGSGGLTMAGGAQTLTGNSSGFNGLTTVQGGALFVNSVLGGTVEVTGGRLQGIGSVGNTTNFAGGTVAPGNGGIGTLTIAGNYVGSGGTLEIGSVLGGDGSSASRLAVTGDTSGSTNVKVVNLGGGGAQTTEGIKIIQVGGASNGAFSLLGDYVFHGQQAVIGGAYAYTLQKNGIADPADGDWYLRSSLLNPPPVAPSGPIYQPGVPLYEIYPQVLQTLNSLPTLLQRAGNRYWEADAIRTGTASVGDQPGEGQSVIWGRTEGSYGKATPSGSVTVRDYNIGEWKARTGVDGRLYQDDNGMLIGGITAHYGQAIAAVRSKYGDGRINTTGAGAGGTLTWYGVNGFYVDGQAQATFFDTDFKANLVNRSMANGVGAVGYALSLETGKRIGIDGPWTLTPQAQLVYSAVNSSFLDNFGADVSIGRNNSLTGRLGLALDHQQSWRDARGTLTRANVYGITNVYYEFLGNTGVTVGGTGFASSLDRLAAGFGIGGTYNWDNDKYSIYGEALVKTSFNDAYSVGGTGGFRMKW